MTAFNGGEFRQQKCHSGTYLLRLTLWTAKVEIYGFQPNTVKWFKSFLSGRSQCVKMGRTITFRMELASGVPQGDVLSPLIFVLYVSDLEAWLKWSSAKTFADDTITGTSAKNKEAFCEPT